MDLRVETADYLFYLDGVGLSFVSIFMEKFLKTSVKEGNYYLTKKEVKKLIDYLELEENKFNNKDYFIDNFKRMEMLMKSEEKARFLYW